MPKSRMWLAFYAAIGTGLLIGMILYGAAFLGIHELVHNPLIDVRRKLLGVELAVALGKLDLGDMDVEEAKRLARRAVEMIGSGDVGYTLITATKV